MEIDEDAKRMKKDKLEKKEEMNRNLKYVS
jgi:hypothetical protein